MEELSIGDKTYISSKRAAEITGYAKDYVGQLCREGRIEARLVGRSWYISEASIRAHRFGASAEEETEVQKEEIIEEEKIPVLESTWSNPNYISEEVSVLPQLKTVKPEVTQEIKEEPKDNKVTHVEDMQTAWQEWFTREEEKKEEKFVPTAEPQTIFREENIYINKIKVPEPVRQMDIQPKVVERPAPQAPTSTAYYVQPNKGKKRPVTKKGGLVTKAVVLSILLIIISITLIGTGILDRYIVSEVSNSPIYNFLGGANTLNK